MSNDSAAAIRQERRDWVTKHLQMYLSSGGTQGHVMDVTDVGGHAFTTHCLIKHTGRKSGRTFITPLIYGDIGGEVVIVASKGGADQYPDWYLNLRAGPHVDFQIATQAFCATWREPEDIERHSIWNFLVEIYPPYLACQASTERWIPVWTSRFSSRFTKLCADFDYAVSAGWYAMLHTDKRDSVRRRLSSR